MLGILATSVLTSPLRLAERLLWGRRVRRTAIDAAPIFIQGFARSGTTHLHNLIAHDPNLGYVSTFQAFASPFFMVSRGWLQRLIGKGLPSTRPMDNMAVSLDLPQEEEFALAAVSDLSAVHQLSFPRRAKEIVAKMGAMRLTAREMSRWGSCYLDVLRKATLATGGRRLVLKTPANLGRTPVLLRLFPDAKFVFIVRNPYVVFCSTMKLYRTMIPMCQLQDVNWRDIRGVHDRQLRRHDAPLPSPPLVDSEGELGRSALRGHRERSPGVSRGDLRHLGAPRLGPGSRAYCRLRGDARQLPQEPLSVRPNPHRDG